MTDRLPPTAEGIARAAELLAGGAVVAFPTDTVYGVGVAASRPDRLEALFALKRRPADRRIPMLVSGPGGRASVSVPRSTIGPAHSPLASGRGPSPSCCRSADDTQAFRVPDHPVAIALIQAAGPMLATSANVSDEPDTLGADEVLIAFATQQDELAAVVDGGPVPGGVASTVIDLSVTPARVLREGPIGREELSEVVDLAP